MFIHNQIYNDVFLKVAFNTVTPDNDKPYPIMLKNNLPFTYILNENNHPALSRFILCFL